jgi:proline iminopeptidase
LTTPGAAAGEDQSPKPRSRAEAIDVVRGLRHIATPHGIERQDTVNIGGIQQAVSIRGDEANNPILLVIHGGPGYVEMPLSWWYARGWEEYFTVVEWDQRGAGKTYLLNDPKEVAYLGLELARRHPNWLYAYIATGQIVNGPESERRAFDAALRSARTDHNAQALSELNAIAPYPKPGVTASVADIATTHKWSDFYGGVMAYRHDQEDERRAGRLSPDYNDAEAPHIFDGNEFSEAALLPFTMTIDFSDVTRLACPIILLEGRHDRTTNAELAYAWFQKLAAPAKTFVWFDNSAHEPESEEPGKFLLSLVRYALPKATQSPAP